MSKILGKARKLLADLNHGEGWPNEVRVDEMWWDSVPESVISDHQRFVSREVGTGGLP